MSDDMSKNEVCSFCKGSAVEGVHIPSDFSDREPSRDGKVFVAKCDECGKYDSDTKAAEIVAKRMGWEILKSMDSTDATDPRDVVAAEGKDWYRPYFRCTLEQAESVHQRSKRKSWDAYFMDIAKQVATRATCDRKHVGAVIVLDRTVLSTGYNGSVKGMPHCDEVGHMMEDGHCVRTVHAEANAIIQAAKNGTGINEATIYTTASPCWWCFKLIVNSGISKIVFGEMYRDERITQFAAEAGIELVNLSVK